MNTRATITLLVFLGWGSLSTWWYTCKIKGVCPQKESETAMVIAPPVSNEQPPAMNDTASTEKAVTETLKKVTILFSSGSVAQEKNPEIDAYIRALADQLKTSGKKITVVGHTDNSGDEQLNMDLGMQRAESVKSTLVNLGADPANIDCISKGETQPVASNDSEEGKRQNRRVEILFN